MVFTSSAKMIAEGFAAKTTKDKAKPIPYSDSTQKNSFIKLISIELTITAILWKIFLTIIFIQTN